MRAINRLMIMIDASMSVLLDVHCNKYESSGVFVNQLSVE